MRKLREQDDRTSNPSQAASQKNESASGMGHTPKRRQFSTQMMDIGVEDNPPPVMGSEQTRAEKMLQIKEALAMVDRPAQRTAASGGTLPPLRKTAKVQQPVRTEPPAAFAKTVVKSPVRTGTPAKPSRSSAQNPEAPQTAIPPKSTIVPDAQRRIGKLKPLHDSQKSSAVKRAAADTAPLPRLPEQTMQQGAKTASARPQKPSAAVPTESKRKPAPTQKSQKPRSSSRFAGWKIGVFAGGGIAGICLLVHFIMLGSYRGKFLPNTFINHIAVGGMTTEEAENALLEAARCSDLTLVTAKGDTVIFHPEDFGATYSLPADALQEAESENHTAWFKKLTHSTEYTVTYDFTYSTEQLSQLIQDYHWGDAVSTDAYITKTENGTFEIIPETLGDQFDTPTLVAYISEQMGTGNYKISMEDSGCYKPYLASVRAEDLTEKLDICNRYANCTITFDFEDRQKVIDGQMISEWADVNENGDVVFNYDAIADYVAEMAYETDTYGTSREFYATLDGWITLPWSSSSNYGWQIAQGATTDQIIDLLNAGESVTVEPIYTDWGYGYCRATDDIGLDYVEVDISAQHVWLYLGGSVYIESDCVTGMESDPDRTTHRGICQILSRESPAVLGTMENQGYETPVEYWMPFNYNGEGLHDLGRSAYGGDIYYYNGSHGCVNLPLDFAAQLYANVSYGMPVIVHE